MTRMLGRLGLMWVMAGLVAAGPAWGQGSADLAAGAKREGKLVSYGMSDDWVNFENIFKAPSRSATASSTPTPT